MIHDNQIVFFLRGARFVCRKALLLLRILCVAINLEDGNVSPRAYWHDYLGVIIYQIADKSSLVMMLTLRYIKI